MTVAPIGTAIPMGAEKSTGEMTSQCNGIAMHDPVVTGSVVIAGFPPAVKRFCAPLPASGPVRYARPQR
jgi:hypothetical protein